jgi:hypothetical protein
VVYTDRTVRLQSEAQNCTMQGRKCKRRPSV